MNVMPLTITSQMGREPLPVTGEPQIAYLLVDAQANSAALPERHLPLNLGFVLDCSGSMRGPRLNALKESLIQIIDYLSADDILSVVTFDDMVDLVVPAQPVEERESLKTAVSLIEDGGGTAMSLGLSLGMAELRKYAGPERVSRMILLTDGATRGEEEQCQTLAASAGTEGIPIVTFGFGPEWDDAFLEMIGARSGGPPPEYVRTPGEIGAIFMRQVRAAQAVALRGVQMQVRFVAGITPRHVTRVAPFARPVDASISDRAVTLLLGDVERNVPQRLLIEVLIEPKRGGTFRIAQIEANAQSDDDEPATVRADVVVTFSGSASKRPQLHPVVLHYIERVIAARIVLRALEDPQAERPHLAPNVARLFDAEGRDLLGTLWAGTPLAPEGRKTLFAKARELTHLRRSVLVR
jgi:Ca-activated chloride channel family protein